MPLDMFALAESEGITVDFIDFAPPINGLYYAADDLSPAIGLAKRIENDQSLLRCVFAEELGHHFTSVGDYLPKECYNYADRLKVSKIEYRAMRWAAQYLMPLDKLYVCFHEGIVTMWELADYFTATEDMVRFRLALPDMKKQNRLSQH
jgi:Zn-dependent peptidase ImmA (M78 family)